MKWIKRLFSRDAEAPAERARSRPERPADWRLTLEDLFAEMKAGRRGSVGGLEAEWARAYERSLIPEGTRFPRRGDLYAARRDLKVDYMTAWAAPFTGGGEAVLLEGERVWVESDPGDDRPLGAYALAVDYDTLERRMVPREVREDPRYGGFYFYFRTVDLNRDFTLVQTGFTGGKKPG